MATHNKHDSSSGIDAPPSSPPNMEKDARQICERVSLVRNSLLSSNYQNRWDRVGMRQVINRLFMFIQEPSVLVFLRKNTGSIEDHSYTAVYHTLQDPLWKSHFETFLSEHVGILAGDHIMVDPKEFSGQFFRLSDSIHILFFYIEIIDYIPRFFYDNERISFAERGIDFLLGSFQSDSRLHDFFINEMVEEEISNQSRYWNNGSLVNQFTDISLGFEPGIDASLFSECYESFLHIFDVTYQRIYNSPLISQFKKNPPNILFFVKQYSNEFGRYHGRSGGDTPYYSHGVRMIIPDSQLLHIEKALSTISKCDADNNSFCFPVETVDMKGGVYVYTPTGRTVKRPRFKGGDDDFFWRLIKTPEGRKEILNDMAANFGPKARSLSDPVLESGYVHFKHHPFEEGRSNRLEANVISEGSTSRDYRRLVCYHYVMHMMAPIYKAAHGTQAAEELSAILVPGYAGGATWFSMGFLSLNKRAPHDRWLDNYHFYHSVCHYLARGVRSKLRYLYLNKIKEIYLKFLHDIVNDLVVTDVFTPLRVIEALNPRLKTLCRIFPFELIQFNLDSSGIKSRCFVHKFLNRVPYAVSIVDNPYFQRQIQGIALEASEIEARIKNAFLESDQVLILKAQELSRLSKASPDSKKH